MPFCPTCGKEYSLEVSYCNNCGSQVPPSSVNAPYAVPQYQPQNPMTHAKPKAKLNFTAYIIGGIISALVALFFFPPVFGMIALFCGGHMLVKSDYGDQKLIGLFIIVLGVICLIYGIFLEGGLG